MYIHFNKALTRLISFSFGNLRCCYNHAHPFSPKGPIVAMITLRSATASKKEQTSEQRRAIALTSNHSKPNSPALHGKSRNLHDNEGEGDRSAHLRQGSQEMLVA
ncbi:MAG: hypothetical protein ACXWOX_07090 [Ktedonobacteraceae bacterium]